LVIANLARPIAEFNESLELEMFKKEVLAVKAAESAA